MSEQHTPRHESGVNAQSLEQITNREAPKLSAEELGRNQDISRRVESIRASVEEQAIPAEQSITERLPEEPSGSQAMWLNKELKSLTFTRTMSAVQKKLSPRERAASKIIHQPTIERLSEASAKTIARPSGLLLGGVISFLATLCTYVLAKRSGYDYNYGLFVFSFLGGFMAGVLIEFGYRFIRTLTARN